MNDHNLTKRAAETNFYVTKRRKRKNKGIFKCVAQGRSMVWLSCCIGPSLQFIARDIWVEHPL
jgi:hypothetical protein